jgi:hypothetical protein
MRQAFNDLGFVSFGDWAHCTTLPRVGIVGPVTIIADTQTSAQISQQERAFVCDRLGKNDIAPHKSALLLYIVQSEPHFGDSRGILLDHGIALIPHQQKRGNGETNVRNSLNNNISIHFMHLPYRYK